MEIILVNRKACFDPAPTAFVGVPGRHPGTSTTLLAFDFAVEIRPYQADDTQANIAGHILAKRCKWGFGDTPSGRCTTPLTHPCW